MSAAAPLLAGYFECAVSGADLKIQFNSEVMGALGAAVMEGFKMVPRRGLEVGGLLLGRVESGRIVVEQFEAIPCEHQRGPSWFLSEKDQSALAEAVSRANAAESSNRLVGLFRSHTRAGFTVTPEDVTMMNEYCNSSGHVFLLVKPEALGRSTAFFAAGDNLQNTSEVFPFRAKFAAPPPCVHSSPPPETRESSARAEMPEAGVPAARFQMARVLQGFADDQKLIAAANAHKPPASRFSIQLAWALGIILCSAFSGYGLARWWAGPSPAVQPDPPPAAAMSLHATWTGGSLDLEWDRAAASIRRATRGVLWIDDGPKHRRLDLGIDELMQGTIQYWPTAPDVAFRLEVFSPEGKTTESIRAVSVPVPPPPPAPAAATVSAPTPVKPAPVQKVRRRTESRRRK